MKCPRCQHDNPQAVKFCGECGARLEARCPACGAGNPPTNKFCHECGQALAEGAAPAQFAAPGAYTPRHLAERILTSRTALEGERKQVTVLFADMKGSTELLADRDPEETRKLLDPVLEHMMEAVHRFEGTVNQVMGDGIMALFGAPVAHEDHAVRACYAALQMQETVKRYGEGVRRVEGVPIRIRVGLNSGEVVVRTIGSDLHMDYTAVGQTTHLAARMEQLADPGTVLLTPASLALAEDFIQVRSQGPTPVKGFSDPVEVYELVGATPLRSRFHAHAARGLTSFVGRTTELAELGTALEQARGGRGQVVAVVGEPGVGKSRLFWEFSRSHRTDGCLVLYSASVSYGKPTTYLPVIELLRGYVGIEPGESLRAIREKVTGKLLSLDRALEPVLGPLLSLLDVPTDDPEWARLDPAQRRRRTLEALRRLLLRESQIQPLVLIFEDLHWIDDESHAVLDGLVESLPTAGILLLVNHRPEYRHGWGSRTSFRLLRIDALAAAGAEELLDGLLGTDPALRALKRVLIDRTEGNPLFLEESVRTLIETGALAGALGACRLTRPIEGVQIPATVHAIIAARVDRLDPEDKRLLQTAAVLGKDVPLSLLGAVAALPPEEIRERLARLQAAEFLYETRLFPEVEYAFKHALTLEVAYGGLLNERRTRLHAHVATALERLSGDQTIEQVERLAHHSYLGEVWDKAAEYLRQAADKATARSAQRAAEAHLHRAVLASRRLPESRETLRQTVSLLLDRQRVLFSLSDFEQSLASVREAEAMVTHLADDWLLARTWCERARHHWRAGEAEDAAALSERALALPVVGDDLTLSVAAHDVHGRARWSLGDYRRAVAAFATNVTLLQGRFEQERFGAPGLPSVFALYLLALCHAELGEFTESERYASDAVRVAEAAGNPHSIVAAYFAAGWSSVTRGDIPRATQALEQAMTACQAAEIAVWIPIAAGLLGYTYALAHRPEEAAALGKSALSRSGPFALNRLLRVAETYLLLGRPQDAQALAQEVLDQAVGSGAQGDQAFALKLLGDAAVRHTPPDSETAAARYEQARALAERLGMQPLLAHCHAGFATLYHSADRSEQKEEHLDLTTTMYRALGMTYWLDRLKAELEQTH